ncbi:MAG TPA: hypothetical protein V6C52_03885 [Coleofasciculaceae cyanobacterium]|jgi:hypothetical protein
MGRFFKATLGTTLCLGFLAGNLLLAQADVLHFHNGKVLRGKIHRVTGDIIEFKPGRFSKQNIQRLTLTNRRDVVELNDDRKYFGEILYMDALKVEIITSTGISTLNRLLVKNIVVGSPIQQPMTDFAESLMQQTATQAKPIPAEPGFNNVNWPSGSKSTGTGASSQAAVHFPVDIDEAQANPSASRINPADSEDLDAIPDDRTP